MTRYMTATQARKMFFKMLKIASKPGSAVTIIHQGQPTVTMMSTEELDGWMETMDIMSDPQLMKDIREGADDAKAGRVIQFEDIKKTPPKKK